MRRFRHDDETDCQSNSRTLEIGIAFAGAWCYRVDRGKWPEPFLRDVQIRQVQLQGDLRLLDAKALIRDLSVRFNVNYLETTLCRSSPKLSRILIASASARRVWPDTLLIEITEQRPVAIYNDTQYLGLSGDLFEPPTPVNEPLPRLYGALSETMQIYSHYEVFSDRLSDFSDVASVSRGHDMDGKSPR